MKKEKIVRKLKNVTNSILCGIITVIFTAAIVLPICWVIFVGMCCFIKYDSETIMNAKERAYEIANEGLQSQRYRYNWEISSPDGDDKIQIIESGIKNLKFPDLMKVSIRNDRTGWEFEFSNNEFKTVQVYIYRELKITVDKNDIDDISCYECSQKILWKKIFTHLLVLVIADILIFIFLALLNDLSNELENTSEDTNNANDQNEDDEENDNAKNEDEEEKE